MRGRLGPRMRDFTLGLVACVALATGCQTSAVFQCEEDGQCALEGGDGTCQPNGYCSFGDSACPTGQRYGDQAPGGLAGLCVEPLADDTQTSGDCVGPECAPPTPITGPTSTGETTSGGSTQPDQTSDGSSSSSGSDWQTASSAGTTEDSGSDDSTSSVTGEPTTTGMPACPEFVDEFDNGVVDEAPWQIFDGTGLMSETGGVMRFSIDPSEAFYSFMVLSDLDVTTGYVLAHLVALPQDPSSEFLLRVYDEGGLTGATLGVTGDRRISARLEGAAPTEFVYGPDVTELWLSLTFDGTNVSFNFSPDGSTYTELDSVVSPLVDPGAAEVSMAAGSFSPIMSPAHAIEINVFEHCSTPFGG